MAEDNVVVEQIDRDAAADILDEISNLTQHNGIGQVADLIRDGEYDDHDTVARVARHRIQAREQAMNGAMTALKSVQYSPAPYTDGVKAIRARFLQPADEVEIPATTGA